VDVTAALDFSVSVDGTSTSGSLTGSGSDLRLQVQDPALLGSADRRQARALAAWLAERGLRVSIVSDRWLLTLGEPRVPRWHRVLTGSPHIRLGSLSALARLRARRPSRAAAGPPPPTPLPLAPTFLRRPRQPTTTHDRDRGGYPRLVLVPAEPRPGDPPRHVHHLGPTTAIGSSPECEIRLPGLEPVQARVRQDDADEFVLSSVGSTPVRVNGVAVREAVLRTGTRVQVGTQTLVYAREEYADHGRPFGGRVGGELGRQRPQRPRASRR